MDIRKRIEELKLEIEKLEDEINSGDIGPGKLGEVRHLIDELNDLQKKPDKENKGKSA